MIDRTLLKILRSYILQASGQQSVGPSGKQIS